MAKIKVEVLGAYVDGQGPGSIVSVDEKSAMQLKSIGYVKIVEEPKKAEDSTESKAKAEDSPKKKSSKRKNKEDNK
jgi:hypothetical protein